MPSRMRPAGAGLSDKKRVDLSERERLTWPDVFAKLLDWCKAADWGAVVRLCVVLLTAAVAGAGCMMMVLLLRALL